MAEKGSDLIYEVCCVFCKDDNVNWEATVYCKQCSKGLCDECVKYHKKLYKTHSTLRREDKKMWPVVDTT
ncbi:hypothetical protein DPMN_087699 [Dreissena polymorpha]|uniref:B box-type domain-containing protein n=1 Tax=Dreissena polymorpha TaxID=45954 RepID=A0A9D4KTN0_DREPO|nr:hypothetical protein DPMN_087699 [Dreissena polymorpha]